MNMNILSKISRIPMAGHLRNKIGPIFRLLRNRSGGEKEPWDLRSLVIETTSACNLRCPGCTRTILQREGLWENGLMTVQTFKTIIDGLPRIFRLTLHGTGEPTINKRLPEMVSIARDSGKFGELKLTTNALVRRLNFYKELFASGLDWVNVSVDSFQQSTADVVRAGTNTETLKKRLQELINAFPEKIRVSTVVSKDNVEEINEIARTINRFSTQAST